MNKLLTGVAAIFCFITGHAEAQSISATPAEMKNQVFVELMGSGGFYSLNYERSLTSSLYFRVGISYMNSNNVEIMFPDGKLRRSTRAFTLPVFLGRLMGRNNHYFEVGAGIIPNLFTAETNEDEFFLYGGLVIGYRYQPSAKGIVFRGGFTPWFTFKEFHPLPGLSIGYRF